MAVVGFKDPNDFRDKNRYQGRKSFNKIRKAIWSVCVSALILVGAYYLFQKCYPWLSTLWDTIK